MQGIGYGLLEEVQVEDGRVLTPNLSDFKIPTIQDIPDLVTVLLEPHGGVGPYNIKGIGGEPGRSRGGGHRERGWRTRPAPECATCP